MTNTQGIGAYTPEDAREIKRRVLGTNNRKSQLFNYTEKDKLGWHYGVMKETLDAVCDPLTEYSQGYAAVLMYQDFTNTLDMEEVVPTEFRILLTNRSPFASYFVGELVLFRWVVKEWTIIGQAIQRIQAVMQQNLAAAVDTRDDPSTAKAKVLFKDIDGDMKLLTSEIDVVNRFKHVSINAGTYVKLEYIQGEWQPYAADCPGSSSFSSSESGSDC